MDTVHVAAEVFVIDVTYILSINQSINQSLFICRNKQVQHNSS